MTFLLNKQKPVRFLIVLFLQLTVWIVYFLNLPIAKQIIGFFYFSFIPGYLILKLLAINKLNLAETVLLSVGLSIACMMIIILFINELSVAAGFVRPLSSIYLMVTFNCFTLICIIITYLRKSDLTFDTFSNLRLPISICLFLSLVALSVAGALYVSTFKVNTILLIMLILIALLFSIEGIYKKVLPSKFYSLAVLLIALSLLYHSSLSSAYLCTFASDNPVEYFVAKTTQINGCWNLSIPKFWDIGYGRTNAMLSVTIFPVTYSNLLDIDLIWVFKLIYPLVFSFVPVTLYIIWQRYLGKKYAFFSAFLFMVQNTFYTEMLGLNRQIIAELFFVLLLFVTLKKDMRPIKKSILFIIFGFALITSHYGIAEILLFMYLFAFLSLLLLKYRSKKIRTFMILCFSVMMFSWYIFTSNASTFESLLSYANYVYEQLSDFFNPASRGEYVLRGLGLEPAPTIWNALSRAFAYITEILIVIGFISLVTRRSKVHFEIESFIFISSSMALLTALIFLPGLANTMNMTRFYHILLFFLAPLCAIGAKFIIELLSKYRNEIKTTCFLLAVLIPYFLFQVGFMYEIIKCPSWSLPLSGYRMSPEQLYLMGYIDGSSAASATWLSTKTNSSEWNLCADIISKEGVLTTYGMIYRGYVGTLDNSTELNSKTVIYLSRFNTESGKAIGRSYIWDLANLSLNDMSKIYSNGESYIYCMP